MMKQITWMVLGVVVWYGGILALELLKILCRASRDTWRILSRDELKDGYSRWNWFWIVPLCFWYQVKNQFKWWSVGATSEVI